MKLPSADRVIVDPERIRDYLLSDSHPIGRFKAAFFRSLGFDVARSAELSDAIRSAAVSGEAVVDDLNEYGQKYRVAAVLIGPGGKQVAIVTVWIVLRGEEMPRFVTAFPGGKP